MKKYFLYNHQGKANALMSALSIEYVLAEKPKRVSFVLSDNDVKKRQLLFERIKNTGTKLFFVYPHAARPSLVNSIWPAWEHTTAHFVVNEYHAEVMRAYGYNRPTINIGWFLCPLREFHPTSKNVLSILFAPIHPRNAPQDKAANFAVMRKLSPLARDGKIKLTVRHIGNLQDSGLAPDANATYVRGDAAQAYDDSPDIVVGHQTFAWRCVARGIPTVMMATDMPAHYIKTADEWEDVKCWDTVNPMFRYPLDILKEKDTLELLQRTASSDVEIADWRRRMIGTEFCPQAFRNIIRGYL